MDDEGNPLDCPIELVALLVIQNTVEEDGATIDNCLHFVLTENCKKRPRMLEISPLASAPTDRSIHEDGTFLPI